MKKWFLILAFTVLGATTFVQAQNSEYQIITNYQASEKFILNDLFGFSINNFSGHASDCKLEIRMVQSETHAPIIILASNNLKLENGNNLFISSNFSETYFQNELSSAFRSGQLFQSGRFEICITLTILHSIEKQIKECTSLNFGENFFIHLLIPEYGEKIETLNPLLQWYSSTNDPSIKYRLILAPLGPLRHPEDAITRNIKFLDLNIPDMQFLYPLNAPELEYGKYYAWQVMALKGNEVIGLSEAWTFTPVQNDIHKDDPKDCYRIITKYQNNGNYLYGDVMKFAYQNRTLEPQLNYSIKDLTTDELIDNPPVLKLKPGLNKIDLELKELKGLRDDHQYLIQIRNKDNEICQLTFKPYTRSKRKQQN